MPEQGEGHVTTVVGGQADRYPQDVHDMDDLSPMSSGSMMVIDPSFCSKPTSLNCTTGGVQGLHKVLAYHEQPKLPTSQNLGHSETQPALSSITPKDSPSVTNSFDSDDMAFGLSRYSQTPPPPLSSRLEADMLDFDLGSHEGRYAMEPASTESASTQSDSDEEGCLCLSELVHSLTFKMDIGQAKKDPHEVICILNEISERFIQCDDTHSSLWYIVLLALYQDADENLSRHKESSRETLNRSHLQKDVLDQPGGLSQENNGGRMRQHHRHGNHPGQNPNIADSCTAQRSAKRRSVVLKAFLNLSTIITALPFKLSVPDDDAPDQALITAFARKLLGKFERQLTRPIEVKKFMSQEA
ncbi:hypothetical protein CSHISOI_08135 [Colletotrichum shisoi]|uniref:Uncharacterized protein n=1 Tax=Colletotrichum shisoi TaxID=2078593 RepID=A0A5Q4BKP9_9PEZI|nr:hypothetical protein CSHISOI_08135 [Colletotrichum shisoi]